MKTLDRLVAFLELKGVSYRHDIHPLSYTARETARAEHVPAHVRQGGDRALRGWLLDGRSTLGPHRGSRRTAHRFGTRHLRLAKETELQELFPDCELGAMPPFGNGTLWEIPVWVDGLLMAEETISCNAGTHKDVIQIDTEDWEQLVKPSVLAFAHAAG